MRMNKINYPYKRQQKPHEPSGFIDSKEYTLYDDDDLWNPTYSIQISNKPSVSTIQMIDESIKKYFTEILKCRNQSQLYYQEC